MKETNEIIVQHRQEDSHAVYVRGNKDGNNAKHRHGHAVYVGSDGNSNKKWGVVPDIIADNDCVRRNSKTKSGELNEKKWGVNNEGINKTGHGVQVKDVIENEDRTTNRK